MLEAFLWETGLKLVRAVLRTVQRLKQMRLILSHVYSCALGEELSCHPAAVPECLTLVQGAEKKHALVERFRVLARGRQEASNGDANKIWVR